MESVKNELFTLYQLEFTDVYENLRFCDKETDAFGQGILFGLQMAMGVVERGLQ